jgi:hypothetical protein
MLYLICFKLLMTTSCLACLLLKTLPEAGQALSAVEIKTHN